MTMPAAELMCKSQTGQSSGIPEDTEYRGIFAGMKAAELPDESIAEFSNAPFEFQNKTLVLWQDTQRIYVHACTANRFTENYLMLCNQLEKNIKQLGSFCLTKAVLEQQGLSFPELSQLSIKELVCMVSFHLRKAHAALEGIYRDNNLLGMTYLGWEFRWSGLDDRLRATEVKIQNIKDGKIDTGSMLRKAQVFKDEPRTHSIASDETHDDSPKSLRANPNAFPVNGSMARLMLGMEKEEAKEAEQERRELIRKHRRLEQLERLPGVYKTAKPYEPSKEMMRLNKELEAKVLRAELEAEIQETQTEIDPEPPEKSVQKPEQQKPGTVNEAEARKILLEDAKRRRDREAIREIPLEDNPGLHKRWKQYCERFYRESHAAPSSPPDETRKALRQKRKKKKK